MEPVEQNIDVAIPFPTEEFVEEATKVGDDVHLEVENDSAEEEETEIPSIVEDPIIELPAEDFDFGFHPRPHQQYNPTTLIISYDSEIGKEPLKQAIEEYNAEIIYDYNNFSMMAIKIPSDKTLEEAIQFFETVNGVFMVEKDQIVSINDNVNVNSILF